MGRALIGCCLVATANQSSPHSGPILAIQELNGVEGIGPTMGRAVIG